MGAASGARFRGRKSTSRQIAAAGTYWCSSAQDSGRSSAARSIQIAHVAGDRLEVGLVVQDSIGQVLQGNLEVDLLYLAGTACTPVSGSERLTSEGWRPVRGGGYRELHVTAEHLLLRTRRPTGA